MRHYRRARVCETKKLFDAGEFTKYLYVHGLGVETAEALAEYVHKLMREELGIGGEDAARISDLFHQNIAGSRYSFGYPACPNLEDQVKIFALLQAGREHRCAADQWIPARARAIYFGYRRTSSPGEILRGLFRRLSAALRGAGQLVIELCDFL